MDLDFNGDVTCLDAELLQLPEVSPLAIKANPYVAEKLFDQWLSLPETNSLSAGKRESDGENKVASIMDSKERIEKFRRYEAEFKQYLMSKYFSDKTIFGGNIFDVKMNIDGQTIAASRLPPYQSYLDPVTFHETISKGSSCSAETPTTSASNGKPST